MTTAANDIAPTVDPLAAMGPMLAELVRPIIREEVRRALAELRHAAPTPTIATAAANPLGSPHVFRKWVAEGRFPTFLHGRAKGVGAMWADVVAAIAAQRCAVKAQPSPVPPPDHEEASDEEDALVAELEAAGGAVFARGSRRRSA